ncbi:MAG: hypothetical protein HQ517_04805 [SAR324 cluster bacterium]|nr:hypothetical protein [SAR324 cluster bacterium]
MKDHVDGQTELLPAPCGTLDTGQSNMMPVTNRSPVNKTLPGDELARFYPRVGSYEIVLIETEHVSDAVNSGKIVFKDGMITALEAPTSSGKGYVARYLLQNDTALLLCVDNLRKLVLQTFNRLMPYGKVIHYEKSKAIKAAGSCLMTSNYIPDSCRQFKTE